MSEEKTGFRTSHVVWIVLTTFLLTIIVTFWFVRTYIYARDFTPVQLDASEQQVLDQKLKLLGYEPELPPVEERGGNAGETDERWLRPVPYREIDAQREVGFSERELNGLIANNKDLAKKLALDFSDDLVSARILIPLDPEFPVLGGKTLRVSTGIEMAISNGRPRVILKGVSLMGVPIPNAWLGGIKNVDLISEFGDAGGFWSGFAEGVENIAVREGELKVMLKP